MAYKISVVAVALFVILQLVQARETQDPRIISCTQKIWNQIEQLRWGQIPLCYNYDKLKEVAKETKTFEEFNAEIPEKCKKLNTGNVGECFRIVSGLLNSKKDDLKTSILNSIKGVIGAFGDCIEIVKDRFINLDKYVANGCQDW